MPDATELDDLDALLTLPGWARFSAHLVAEWGPAGQRYQQAVKLAASKVGDDAVHQLRGVLFAQEEIARLLMWPQERLSQLRSRGTGTALPVDSRRGAGL